jgi:hypothetical protein
MGLKAPGMLDVETRYLALFFSGIVSSKKMMSPVWISYVEMTSLRSKVLVLRSFSRSFIMALLLKEF